MKLVYITVIPKPDRQYKKILEQFFIQKLQTDIPHGHRTQILNKKLANRIQQYIERITYHNKVQCIQEIQA